MLCLFSNNIFVAPLPSSSFSVSWFLPFQCNDGKMVKSNIGAKLAQRMMDESHTCKRRQSSPSSELLMSLLKLKTQKADA